MGHIHTEKSNNILISFVEKNWFRKTSSTRVPKEKVNSILLRIKEKLEDNNIALMKMKYNYQYSEKNKFR